MHCMHGRYIIRKSGRTRKVKLIHCKTFRNPRAQHQGEYEIKEEELPNLHPYPKLSKLNDVNRAAEIGILKCKKRRI